MPVDNAGPSFVAWCRGCPWRSTHHLRRDAQQALGRHGETCGMGFGQSRDPVEAAAEQRYRDMAGMDLPREERAARARANREIAHETRATAPRSEFQPGDGRRDHHDGDDEREAGR